MATDLRGLLIEQEENFNALHRIQINFKKLSKANTTSVKIASRLKVLEDIWKKCTATHVRIRQTATGEEQKSARYFTDNKYLAAEDLYQETSDLLNETLSRLEKSSAPAHEHHSDSSFRDANSNSSINLPRITIPKFSGEYSEWENFRNTFESLVVQNALTSSQKLHYLKSSVTGSAARLISNIKISDVNYDVAWRLLLDEFYDKQAIIHAHLHAFVSLPVMKREDVAELKTLRDTVSASIAALRNLARPVDHWDDILVYLITQKFSARTRSEWNLKRNTESAFPTYAELCDFLTHRIRGLSDFPDVLPSSTTKVARPRSTVNNVSVIKCIYCSGNHALYRCEKFLNQKVDKRGEIVRDLKLCFNCLRPNHFTLKCPSKTRCSHCRRSHHSLLLRKVNETPSTPVAQTVATAVAHETLTFRTEDSQSHGRDSAVVIQHVRDAASPSDNILLATAWLDLHTPEGRHITVRALLDQGSTFSFVSESLCQSLHTKRQRVHLQIRYFGDKYTGLVKSKVSLTSRYKRKPAFPLTAYVYQRITSYAASRVRSVGSWSHLHNLTLADPDPSGIQPIHLLIGADLYGSLLDGDLRKGPFGTPTAQSTALEWILSGLTGIIEQLPECSPVLHCVSEDRTDDLLQKFWELEEVPHCNPLTASEEQYERHFKETHSRSPSGRYVVRLPFKQDHPPQLVESRSIALALYERSAAHLKRNPEIWSQYDEFLREYKALGHMESVEETESLPVTPVYIPHHAVLREASTTTKLRVVFNAWCKTRDGTSLNDHLLIGPKLQQDLAAILLRWRQWRYVYTTDIVKMFRQILLDPRDTDFQRILWRPDDASHIQSFRLLTVTYGMAPAPYLAIRVLQQLAADEGHAFPKAVPLLNNALYVEDTLFGADNIDSLREERDQLIGLMSCGGFQLRKWASNSPPLLSDVPVNHHESGDHLLVRDENLKVLGLAWNAQRDTFSFMVNFAPPPLPTKRSSIFSFVAKLYDPLGWAAPVIIVAKILIQELWLRKSDWDESVPLDIQQRWDDYLSSLPLLNSVRISRWTGQRQAAPGLEIHGFADASSRAYAAVAYLRVPL